MGDKAYTEFGGDMAKRLIALLVLTVSSLVFPSHATGQEYEPEDADLVINSEFENGLSGWQLSEPANITTTTFNNGCDYLGSNCNETKKLIQLDNQARVFQTFTAPAGTYYYHLRLPQRSFTEITGCLPRSGLSSYVVTGICTYSEETVVTISVEGRKTWNTEIGNVSFIPSNWYEILTAIPTPSIAETPQITDLDTSAFGVAPLATPIDTSLFVITQTEGLSMSLDFTVDDVQTIFSHTRGVMQWINTVPVLSMFVYGFIIMLSLRVILKIVRRQLRGGYVSGRDMGPSVLEEV